jgi:hypothetical protein
MSTNSFGPLPSHLTAEQQAQWLQRQQTAQLALDTQGMAGTVPNTETMAAFRRYVKGEISLAEAIGHARAQLAQEHAAFQQFLNRRNII